MIPTERRWLREEIDRYESSPNPVTTILQVVFEANDDIAKDELWLELDQNLKNVMVGCVVMRFYCMPGGGHPECYLTRATYLHKVQAIVMKTFFDRFNSSEYVRSRGKATFIMSVPIDYDYLRPIQ